MNRPVSFDILYRCLKFVSMYPQQSEVIKWQKCGLTWSKMTLLLAVEDASLRSELLQKTLEQQWSWRRLRDEIVRLGGNRRRRRGRRPREPESLNDQADLERLVRFNEEWLLFWKNVWQRKKASSVRAIARTVDGRETIDKALDQIRAIQAAILELAAKLDSGKVR